MNCVATRHELRSYPSPETLARATADRWLTELANRPAAQERFAVALSGGRIAPSFYDAVVAATAGRLALWSTVEFFFADERWVPPDNDASNYQLARVHLFDPLQIEAGRVHPLFLGRSPGFDAAQAQSELLGRAPVTVQGDPILDLVILGLGEDGHIASLFPDAPPEVVNSRAVYLPVMGPKPPPQRLTLSYPVLAAARRVWVLISGPGKETALRESLSPTGQTPLARVIQSRTRTLLFTDFAL